MSSSSPNNTLCTSCLLQSVSVLTNGIQYGIQGKIKKPQKRQEWRSHAVSKASKMIMYG